MDTSNPRHRKQMIAFYASGLFSLACLWRARRSVTLRKYSPTLFDANHRPPSFNMMKDAMQAVGQATGIAVSTFAFVISGVCWTCDIASFPEFSRTMKAKFGGAASEARIAALPVEPEVAKMEKDLNDALK